MITVIAALCLFTTVKTGITGLRQAQTVKIGNNVTMKCDQNIDNDKHSTGLLLAWYKQSLGNMPTHIVRLIGGQKNSRFASDFALSRFTVDGDTFDLSINETKEEDSALYFCGKVSSSNILEFESGTLLFVEAEKTDWYPPTKMVIKSGQSATIQCSVQSMSCSEDHSVYWFRHGSGESDPGIIFTHGNRSDQCKKSSETASPTQSCVYKLPKNNLSLSDAGTYYCAVAACGEIIFGSGSEVIVTENNWWIVIALATLNVISVIVIIVLVGVLFRVHQKGAANHHSTHLNQAEDTDAVNYAALNFAKKVPPSRAFRVQDSQDIYSRVKFS